MNLVAHALRGEGFDASEDGTGRGTPLVPAIVSQAMSSKWAKGTAGPAGDEHHNLIPVPFDTTQITSPSNYSAPQSGDPCHPLAAGAHAPAIAFPANLSGTQCVSTEELAPSMGAANPTAVAYGIRTANTSSNGWGVQEECTHTLDCAQGVAVAVALRGREGGATAGLGDEVQNCLRASSGGGDKPHVLTAMQVRRLTPEECEALQGFPRSYTAIPWRGKPASECPDGPRYKSLGNSWAVNCARWIGERIEAVEAA